MKGLELSRQFFFELGLPLLNEKFGTLTERMAFGLVGEGSDCFGFDDEISRDHDWGPGFCIWLTSEDFREYGSVIGQVYRDLPAGFLGYRRAISPWGNERTGVMEIGGFYRRFLNLDRVPQSFREWIAVPEPALAAAVNGQVFLDPLGEFSRIRTALLAYYPEDLRLKKLAARCMSAGQAGQYNLPRSMKRGQQYAARYSEIQFCQDAMSMVFLLNRKYAPFYKWIHPALSGLPVLGAYMSGAVGRIAASCDGGEKTVLAEEIAGKLISVLRELNLSDSESDFLPDHGPEITKRIADAGLRDLKTGEGRHG